MKIFFTLMMILCQTVVFAQSPQVDELLRSADNAYEENDYAKAAAAYEKVLLVEHKDHKILNRAGISYFKLENFAKAKDKFRLAALYGPVNDDVTMSSYYSNLSACYTYLNEDSKAFEYALKGYNLDKSSSFAFWNAASNAQNVGRYTDCIKIMNESSLPKLNVLNTLYARSYLGLKEYNKSIKHYEDFFANYVPDEMDVNINLDDERYFYFKALLYGGNQDHLNPEIKKKYQKTQIALFEKLKNTKWAPKILELMLQEKNSADEGKNMSEETLEQIYSKDNLSDLEKIQVENRLANFKGAYKTGTDYLKSHSDKTTAVYKKMKLYQYVASMSLLLNHFKKNKSEDPQLLKQTISHLKAFYEPNKNYLHTEIEGNTELLEPIQYSFSALRQLYPDEEEKKETAELFYKVLENIPSSETRTFFGKMKELKVFTN